MKEILCFICVFSFALASGDEPKDADFLKAISYLQDAEKLSHTIQNKDIGKGVSTIISVYIDKFSAAYQANDIEKLKDDAETLFENFDEIAADCQGSREQLCSLIQSACKHIERYKTH